MLTRTALVLCLLSPAWSWSATISGKVTAASGGAAIAGFDVLLSIQGAKGWNIFQTTLTDGSGNYLLTVGAGDYIVQAVPFTNASNCLFARRYYDVAAPNAGGTVESAADVITLATGTALTGVDFSIPAAGAIDGRVTQAGVGVNGMQFRVESTSDERIHADGVTTTIMGVAGSFAICGVDPGPQRLWIHHPNATAEDLIAPGPYLVSAGLRANAGSLALTPIGSDPYEPNGTTGPGFNVPAGPTNPWESSNAILTPRGSDLDFHCFFALAGERYVITTTTTSIVAGQPRPSPWLDPTLGWYLGTQRLLTNDDDPTISGSRNARIDTGVLAADGRYCAGVTSFGDVNFTGSGQTSAGRYAIRIGSDAMFADGFEDLP